LLDGEMRNDRRAVSHTLYRHLDQTLGSTWCPWDQHGDARQRPRIRNFFRP
jgi:hypothetical protein